MVKESAENQKCNLMCALSRIPALDILICRIVRPALMTVMSIGRREYVKGEKR